MSDSCELAPLPAPVTAPAGQAETSPAQVAQAILADYQSQVQTRNIVIGVLAIATAYLYGKYVFMPSQKELKGHRARAAAGG